MAVVAGRRRRIRAAGGLVAEGGALTHFQVAGADRVFHPATAEIDVMTLLEDTERTVDLSTAEDVALQVTSVSEPLPYLSKVTLSASYTVAGGAYEQHLETIMFLPP